MPELIETVRRSSQKLGSGFLGNPSFDSRIKHCFSLEYRLAFSYLSSFFLISDYPAPPSSSSSWRGTVYNAR